MATSYPLVSAATRNNV